MWNPTHASGASGGGGGGVTDHGALTGLGDDDHTQYALWAAIQASQLCNEVMNHPSLEGADNALPEWWENGANSALTEVDIAGEAGITETWERGFKVVTTAVAAYSYQRYTYADQPRIKSGRALSAIFAVWSVGGIAARIRLITSAGTTVVSANTTAAGWTILTAENLTLDGTYVDIRLEADNGTAYFVPLGINVGTKAVPLRPRGLRYRSNSTPVLVKTLAGLADEATWTDVDCTAASSPLAAVGVLEFNVGDASDKFYVGCRRNGVAGAAYDGLYEILQTQGVDGKSAQNQVHQQFDDGQLFEYWFGRWAGSSTCDAGTIVLHSFYEWE